jgi:hypothetical protein
MGTIDIALRHLTHRFPEQLARGLFGRGPHIEIMGWLDSQLTSKERRADKVLQLVVDGKPCALHVEFQLERDPAFDFRMYEYHTLLAHNLYREAREQADANLVEIPEIRSCAIILRGQEEFEPGWQSITSSLEKDPFSGVHYWLEPIYQRTVDELWDWDAPFWLGFAPLTRNASISMLEETIYRLEQNVDSETFVEIGASMSMLADAMPEGQAFAQLVRNILGEERIMESSFARDIFDKGCKQGIELGERRTLLAIADEFVSGDELRELEEIEDISELRDRVMKLITPNR